MTLYVFMRHGDADYAQPRKWKAPGWGADLASLTPKGEKQIQASAAAIKDFDPHIAICSPTARTLHSALILQEKLKIPFKVEFDLHEWVPDSKFRWKSIEEVLAHLENYRKNDGEWPNGKARPWEPASKVRARVMHVLNQYLKYQRVLVVTHSMVIEAITENRSTPCGGLVPFKIDSYK